MSEENNMDDSAANDDTKQDAVVVHKRFRILCCVDGSEESFKALHYAVRIGSGNDADLTMLYVRPTDQGMGSGGLDSSIARENMLDWGLELPGTKALKQARDMLVELGWLDEEWEHEFSNISVVGDPAGDNVTTYHSDEGRSITLKLLTAPSIVEGILTEAAAEDYDLTIVAKSDGEDAAGQGFIAPEMADEVASSHSGTVLVTRVLEESHGHLVCVSADPRSAEAARQDAEIASRCACPVYLFSVAETEDDRAAAEFAIEVAKQAIATVGIEPSGEIVAIGNPLDEIVEEGKKYSVIVVSGSSSRTGWRRLLTQSFAMQVLTNAHNSVMIRR